MSHQYHNVILAPVYFGHMKLRIVCKIAAMPCIPVYHETAVNPPQMMKCNCNHF